MNKFGVGVLTATVVAAALLESAAPASAAGAQVGLAAIALNTDVSHVQWVIQNGQQVKTPPVPVIGDGSLTD